jgi:predicted transposase/invertase (TIGR01784 family)
MASEVLITISKDEAEQARLMSEYKYVVDTQSKAVQAKREGRQEGSKQKAVEIAIKMKERGTPVEQIAEYTGLSPGDIAKL